MTIPRDGSVSGTMVVLLLVAISIAVAIGQLICGVRIAGSTGAHDGAFAIASFVQFESEIAAGHIPRWVVSGNAGLGSPEFYIYPPGAYYAAALLSPVLPALSPATVIGVVGVLLRIGALVACFIWLRRRVAAEAALTGSALYALMPWISVFNPQVRLDFAECAATALVPLAFLALDAGRGRALRTIVFVAAAICAMTLVHVPTMLVTGGLLVIYATLSTEAWIWRDGLRSAVSASVGIALGLGLAGCYLLPALGLLHATSASAALWSPDHQPEGHFILASYTFHSRLGMLVDAGVLVPVLLVAIFCGTAILRRRTSSALVVTFAVAVFFTMPLSAPVWAILTPLRAVQFPGRFLVPVSLLASALVATALPSGGPALRRKVLAAGFALGTAGIAFSVWFGDGGSSGAVRTHQGLTHPNSNVAEYIPAEAAVHGWLGFAQQNGDVQARAAEFVSPCVRRPSQLESGADDRLRFDVSDCAAPTVLPQFYFPGWVAQADGSTFAVTPDAASGLVSVALPPATRTVTLRRTWLPIERSGLLLSAVSLSLWLGILFAGNGSSGAEHPWRVRSGLRADSYRDRPS